MMPAVTPHDATTVYPPNLTKVQWSLLEQLAAGWMLVDGAGGRMDMHSDGTIATVDAAIRYGRFSKQSVQAMRKRGYIIRYAMPAPGYYITAQGRAALAFKPQEVQR